MSKMSQRTAVANAIYNVLADAGIQVAEGTDVRTVMTKELRAQVNAILFAGFKAGEIELKVEKDDAELKSYVSGLQSNWLNKAKELNGGTKYVAKNPGSRAGSSDPQVKALRALLATKTGDEAEEIQSYIDARLADIGETKKTKTVKVNFDDLPAELKAKYATK